MRSGKRIALSSRDLEIFRLLRDYRYLRSNHIHAFVGGLSATRFKERMGDLFHEGYVQRPEQQWKFADARCQPVVYTIAPAAVRVLEEQEIGPAESRTYLGPTAHRQFAHATLICDVLASFELQARTLAGLRFIPWSEILAHAPLVTRQSSTPFRMPILTGAVIPDALFGLEYTRWDRRLYRFFALEVDRGTMPITRSGAHQSSYTGKLATYVKLLERQAPKTHFGLSTFLVLTLTTSERHKTEIMEQLRTQSERYAAFLFQACSETELRHPNLDLLAHDWARVGQTALNIGRA